MSQLVDGKSSGTRPELLSPLRLGRTGVPGRRTDPLSCTAGLVPIESVTKGHTGTRSVVERDLESKRVDILFPNLHSYSRMSGFLHLPLGWGYGVGAESQITVVGVGRGQRDR